MFLPDTEGHVHYDSFNWRGSHSHRQAVQVEADGEEPLLILTKPGHTTK